MPSPSLIRVPTLQTQGLDEARAGSINELIAFIDRHPRLLVLTGAGLSTRSGIPAYRNAQILVAGENFGCGSSREHAPWALLDFGIRCVIAPSFADIFFNNCFKNGILPIVLPQEDVDKLMDDAGRGANAVVTVDLESQTITGPDGGSITFDVDPFRKHCLLNGLDDIGLTMEKAASIDTFEAQAAQARPWV